MCQYVWTKMITRGLLFCTWQKFMRGLLLFVYPDSVPAIADKYYELEM